MNVNDGTLGPTGQWLVGGGEMGQRIREYDWSASTLGPLDEWPPSLTTALSIMLGGQYPQLIWWGDEFIQFYNDACIPVLGKRHPAALGHPGPAVWPEVWPLVGPLAEAILRGGESYWNEERLIVMTRNGFPEEVYMTCSYGPIRDEAGTVRGVFCTCTEETQRVVGRRRNRTLRSFAEQATHAASAEEACALAAATLADSAHDLPFALLYLLEADGQHVTLAGRSGIAADSPACPARADITSPQAAWPFLQAAATGRRVLVETLPTHWGHLPGGPWPEASQQAVVLPIPSPAQSPAAGFLVAGISPRLVFNDDYQGFLDLLAAQLATAVGNARAHQQERARTESALRANDAWLAGQKEAFEAVIKGAPLETSLGILVRTAIAQSDADMRCAFYLADPAWRELHHVVGMSETYAECVDGFKIGPDSLACGLAVYTGKPVITADVGQDPRWQPWLWLAEKYDYRACWSFPIETSSRKVVGTLAMYFRLPRQATPREQQFAELLTGAAALIIERHTAEGALRASEERYRILVDQALDGIFLADARGRNIDVNEAGAKMLGYSREEVRGLKASDVILAEDAASRAHQMAQLCSGAGEASEMRFRRKDNSTFTGEVVGRQLPDGRLLGIVRDVSARKEAERVLQAAKADAERANQAKSRFLAAASHDLRQPLSALTLYVGSLAPRLPATDQDLISHMKQCVGSLTDMLSAMLDLSRLEAGAVKARISDFAIDEMFDNIAAALAPRAHEKGLTMRCRHGGVYGHSDPVLLQRIVTNFASNAIRYTERGGLLLACRRKGGRLWIEVWDTGIGIPDGMSAEIFEEFRQLGNVERNLEKGVGLGLSIVAKEAALLGLEVRVASRLGRGSMFAVELPAGQPTAAPAPHRRTPPPRRIALVEDNPSVGKALCYVLAALGHSVLYGSGRDEVLAQLGDLAPDIVISDYRLAAGENGYDVITALRRRFGAGLPAMLITGDTDPAIIRDMVQWGIHIQHKPLDLDTFCTALAELTAQEGRDALRG